MVGRRGNGEGSITKRKDGLYMARYTVETATGTKRETIYARTRREAAEKLSEALADRDKGLFFDAGSMTVSEFVTRWLEDSAKGNLAPRSYHNYRLQLRQHIIPSIGRVKLSKLSPANVQALYAAKLSYGLKPSSVRSIHAVLHCALEQAVKWNLIPRNPARAVDPPKVREEEITPLDSEQARKFLDAASSETKVA